MTTLSNTSTAAHTAAQRAITILGAGHIGFAMALLLQQAGDYDILVVDRDPARLAKVAALGVSTQLATDDASLKAAIDGRFAVLNALPFHRAVPVATLCAEAGVHLTLEPWTIENTFMTPTLKLKRNNLTAHFAEAIDGMYQKPGR